MSEALLLMASLATNLALQFDCPETGAMHRLACHGDNRGP